ncbi:MAG: hypothetical protein ACM3NH_02665 [Candidatus Saccharibacteria bacterium]
MDTNENFPVAAKQVILGAVSYLALVADWWLVSLALYGHRSLAFWLWATGAIIVSICVNSFFSLVRPNRVLLLAVHLAGLVTYLMIMPKDFYVMLGGAVFFIFSVIFSGWIAKEGENLLNFSVNRTVGTTQSLLIYGFLLLLGLNIYYNTSQDFKRNPDQFYSRFSDSVARGIPFFSQNISPETNLNESLDQYLLTQTKDVQGGSIDRLPDRQKNSLLMQARQEFTKQFGINASGSETMSEVVSQIIAERTRGIFDRLGKYFPIIFTLIIVALLRTFMFVFSWLSLFFAWLMYRLLLVLRFFRLEKVAIEVQKLRL